MAPVTNAQVILNEYPTGHPEPGKTLVVDKSKTIDLDNEPLNGGVLVENLALSIEPVLRGAMLETRLPSGVGGGILGKPIPGFSVSKVIRSENSDFSVGDHLLGLHSFAEYAILHDLTRFNKLDKSLGLPWSTYLGICGMPGKTAHHGYKEYIQPYAKKGDTIYVTTGAGPVGSTVVQLAKLDGLKVIASASSEEKVKFMKECGADVAFNYKTTSIKEVLAEHGPINFYWDHVGGETLDCALEASAQFARFVICGQMTAFSGESHPIKNFVHVLFKSITVNGYIMSNFEAKYGGAFMEFVPPLVAKGQFKYREDTRRGLDAVCQTLLDVLTGKNEGKAVVVVADDSPRLV